MDAFESGVWMVPEAGRSKDGASTFLVTVFPAVGAAPLFSPRGFASPGITARESHPPHALASRIQSNGLQRSRGRSP